MGKASVTTTQQPTTRKITTEDVSLGVVEVKEPETDEMSDQYEVGDDGIPDHRWTMTSRGMEAPREIAEGAELLQQLNFELKQSLHSGKQSKRTIPNLEKTMGLTVARVEFFSEVFRL